MVAQHLNLDGFTQSQVQRKGLNEEKQLEVDPSMCDSGLPL